MKKTLLKYLLSVILSYSFFLISSLINNGLSNIKEFLSDNELHMFALSFSFCLYFIVNYLILKSHFIYMFNEIAYKNKGVIVTNTIFAVLFLGAGIVFFLFILFKVIYENLALEVSFFYLITYFSTFIAFIYTIGDLLKIQKDKHLFYKYLYKYKFIVNILIFLIAIVLIIINKSSENLESQFAYLSLIFTFFALVNSIYQKYLRIDNK